MAEINGNFLNLEESYLFSDIAKKVAAYQKAHPEKRVIRLGIGDVTLPLTPSVTAALHAAVDEMGKAETFHGYGPEQGYDFLRNEIAAYYQSRGVELDAGEIFVSDGAKSDIGNITDLFSSENTALIPDPVYPVYVDTNLMNGRRIVYLKAGESNGFLPMPPAEAKAGLIYLCSPNNPTGAVYSKEQLERWVAYALDCGAVILFDAAYEAYIADPSLPHSIYEIKGAERCAVEFCSLSKTAGFTGTRLGYTVVPYALTAAFGGKEVSLNRLWLRRQTTKFNGVPYIIQKGAQAVFSPEGQKETRELVTYYMKNASVIAEALSAKGIPYVGGINSPYIWMKCPEGLKSWEFFDELLNRCSVVGTPGAGFGANGEGFFRLTSFGNHQDTIEAMERFSAAF